MNVVLSEPGTWMLFRWGWVLMGCMFYLALVVLLVISDRISRRRKRTLRPSPLWMVIALAGLLHLIVAVTLNMIEAMVEGADLTFFWPFYVPLVIVPILVVLLQFAFPNGSRRKGGGEIPQEERTHADRC